MKKLDSKLTILIRLTETAKADIEAIIDHHPSAPLFKTLLAQCDRLTKNSKNLLLKKEDSFSKKMYDAFFKRKEYIASARRTALKKDCLALLSAHLNAFCIASNDIQEIFRKAAAKEKIILETQDTALKKDFVFKKNKIKIRINTAGGDAS